MRVLAAAGTLERAQVLLAAAASPLLAHPAWGPRLVPQLCQTILQAPSSARQVIFCPFLFIEMFYSNNSLLHQYSTPVAPRPPPRAPVLPILREQRHLIIAAPRSCRRCKTACGKKAALRSLCQAVSTV